MKAAALPRGRAPALRRDGGRPAPRGPAVAPTWGLPRAITTAGRAGVGCRVASKRQQVEVAAEPAPAESPFTDSALRTFLLGVSAGALCEAGHVAFKVLSASAGAGFDTLSAALHSVGPPAVLYDHVAALGFWALLYAIECSMILAVLRKYPDQTQAAQHVHGMVTLSKRMLPARLGLLKAALHELVTGTPLTQAQAAASAGAVQAVAVAAPAPAPPPASTAAFTDAPVRDVVGEIEAQAAAPLGLPPPPAAEPPAAPRAPPTLRERRDRKALRPGAWDPEARAAAAAGAQDRRSRELVERKSYLKNFWYAAALSEKLLPGAPLGVDILGTRVVLFREDDGSVRCLDDACPHRAAPLSGGWVARAGAGGHTCVVCPYHAWAIDGEGRLRDVPAAAPGRWPKRPLVGTYPVEERGGFVWLFWGDAGLPADERPPIPFTPELDDPAWHAVYGEIEFDCGHWAVFENAIDIAHVHYLHGSSFGNADQPRIADIKTKRDTFHVEATLSIHNKPASKLWEWTAVDSVPVQAKAMLPSTSAITIQLGQGVSMITFVNTVPISEDRAVNRFCLIRNFAGWEGFDGYARNAMMKILGEDKAMVERLAPERLATEFSLGPDAPQAAFRRLRQEWVDMGYAVAPESVKPRRGLAPDM